MTMVIDRLPHSHADNRSAARIKVGLIAGPALGIASYLLLPAATVNAAGEAVGGLAQPGRVVAAVGVLMAVFWVTEALPIAATALLPLALLPVCSGGAITIQETAAPYAHKLIFLFMGGFLIALALEHWGLHRRIALRTLLLVGTRPTSLVAGFMTATAFLSMWVSNTATVVMMLPIGMSVIALVARTHSPDDPVDNGGHSAPEPTRSPDVANPIPDPDGSPFAVCLMLGIAYAASIGGIGTLVGTPPNTLLAAFVSDRYGLEISFVRWMAIGMPLVVVFLPITWLVLTRIVCPIGRCQPLPGGRDLIRRELASQGPMSRAEWVVLVVFVLTAAAWITRPLLERVALADGRRPLSGLSDTGIAIGAALVLFAFPIDWRRGVFLLTWREARRLPWHVLVLFGGGLSLASAVKTTGLADFLGRGVGGVGEVSAPVMTLIIVTVVIFLTELTSNTATTATFLPVLAAVAAGLNMNPLLMIVPAAIAASCAFMLPVATPPNAVVFASGALTIPQMCKAGLWLNVIGVVLVTALAYGVVIPVLGITPP